MKQIQTSRERPKSAPYLRLKISKRFSNCQVLSSPVPEKKVYNVFANFFEVSGKSHCAKKCKRVPLGVFQHPFFCKIGKNEGWTLCRHLKKLRKKLSQSRKKSAQKMDKGGTRTHVLPLGRRQKAVTYKPSASAVVWFSVSVRHRQLTYKTY